ncbi:MAG TPA: hypothetical protein VJ925_10480 [Longimicrobiales bacterium]|nr:hypothetical protein [Longimicrobiales bacterium]
MSFAYIDSQGKEVSIPGPDALRLRIELGAITDSTRFYDVAEDRWAAASEHEIYRQLKRDVAASQSADFSAGSVGGIDAGDEVSTDEADDLLDDPSHDAADEDLIDDPSHDAVDDDLIDDFEWAGEPEPDRSPSHAELDDDRPDEELDDDPPDAGLDEPGESPEPYFASELDADVLDQTVAGASSHDAEDDPSAEDMMWPEGATADELDEGMATFTLADPDASSTEGRDPGLEEGDEGPLGDENEPEDLGFDFGSVELELEEDEDEGEPGDDVAVAGTDSRSGMPDAEDEALAASVSDDGPDFGMVFEGGAPDDSFAADMEPDSDESDTDGAEPGSDDADRPADSAGAAEEGDASRQDPYHRTVRERRGPRSSPPRRGGGSGVTRTIAAVFVLVAVVGGAAWFMNGSDGEEADAAVVALPTLPSQLEPEFRQLAQNASNSMVAEFDSLPQRLALPDEPGPQWLSGPYLSGASRFTGVEQYWEDFDALLDAIVASEDDLWAAAWEEQLAQADLTADAEARIRERGMMGWAAAAPDRAVVQEQLRGVIDASLGLHRFLVDNESAITYDPSTGGGEGDPVLEVVTATPELGDEMWTGVGQITVALDALGYIQQVETEPLLDAVKARLVTVGIR